MAGERPRKDPARGGMDPEDIARIDAEEYDEPGRDLMHTRPAEPSEKSGRAAKGDVNNPVAGTQSHGTDPKGESHRGSDSTNKLAHGRNS